jgi:hypothetical protein
MQNIIVVHSNIKNNFFNITRVCYLYNNDWPQSTTSSRGGTHPWVLLRPLVYLTYNTYHKLPIMKLNQLHYNLKSKFLLPK